MRIVSLVPSLSELLFSFGLDREVVGITKFCVHPPEWFRTKVRVGGTKDLHLPLIHSLTPDLIIANKEENTKEQIEELQEEYRVLVTDIDTAQHALQMISEVGAATGRAEKAAALIRNIRKEMQLTDSLLKKDTPRTCLYMIWNDPLMAAGEHTFIGNQLLHAGMQNVITGHHRRYPVITEEEIRALSPEFIFLSSEPFPYTEKHRHEYQKKFPLSKIVCTNGEMFSWYGYRMLPAEKYFRELVSNLRTS
ncbi:MAG: ABC transporter substrate-binding protein [Bacteroidia bacterium]|nr:ABC transporter substrate-binding protein [Bacteroidia bacterium]